MQPSMKLNKYCIESWSAPPNSTLLLSGYNWMVSVLLLISVFVCMDYCAWDCPAHCKFYVQIYY